MKKPILIMQEIPYDDPQSRHMFRPGPKKQFVATPATLAMYPEAICRCLWHPIRPLTPLFSPFGSDGIATAAERRRTKVFG
jgi:hypothetical protein